MYSHQKYNHDTNTNRTISSICRRLFNWLERISEAQELGKSARTLWWQAITFYGKITKNFHNLAFGLREQQLSNKTWSDTSAFDAAYVKLTATLIDALTADGAKEKDGYGSLVVLHFQVEERKILIANAIENTKAYNRIAAALEKIAGKTVED